MENGNGTQKLELLRKKKEAAIAAIKAAEKAQREQKRLDDARLASVIGHAIIDNCAKQPDSVGVMVRQLLAASSLRETDRAWLATKGWC